jgi:diguanylate cyclase (GGDEF)-like protein
MDTMLEISRTSNARLALLVIKIRQMRDINLSYGYQFGDAVNEKIALMIGNISRLNDHIFSIRNNEFIMILNDINNNGQAELAANRLINDIQRPLEINGTQANIKINIGIAIAPDHGTSADALLKAADMALTETMEGQSQYHIYKDHESKKKPANIILEQDLRQAIHNDELTILYQPKVDLIHRNAIGVEALSRWYSPVHGNVPPDIFIAVAESSDLIQPQTKWLFNNALRQYSACGIDKYTGMSLSLNLSPNLLQNDDITHIINSSLNMWDINPQNIILEITESAIMVNPEKCLKILTSIHDSGIRLSIDDFGTGYSSLAYLKKLPVDELKIDRSFVMNM